MTDLREVDRGLVEGAKTDPVAFARLYNAYFARVYGYVASRVANVETSEDLVSEVFFKVAQGLAGFQWRDNNSFSAWLFRIAHNATASYWREQNKLRALEEGAGSANGLTDLRDRSPMPEEEMLRKEQGEKLRRLVATLTPRRQEVITLRFFGELQNREIASILGLDEHTVAAHICRGLRDLHKLWLLEE